MDPVTAWISQALLKIPKLGKRLADFYLWKFMMFNFMLVGASGTVLSWFLYELVFRNLLFSLWGGTFLAMVIVSCIVFLWNYFLNKAWSLNVDAQILKMDRAQLLHLKEKLEEILAGKFSYDGHRC